MPDDFELKMLATGKRFKRTVDGQGMISWKRYRLYVKVELKKEKIEIREFFDSLVVVYHSGTIVSYECSHEKSDVSSILNTPAFRYLMKGKIKVFFTQRENHTRRAE